MQLQQNASLTCEACLVQGSVARYGSGVDMSQGAQAVFNHSDFEANEATQDGGAARVANGSGALGPVLRSRSLSEPPGKPEPPGRA